MNTTAFSFTHLFSPIGSPPQSQKCVGSLLLNGMAVSDQSYTLRTVIVAKHNLVHMIYDMIRACDIRGQVTLQKNNCTM